MQKCLLKDTPMFQKDPNNGKKLKQIKAAFINGTKAQLM